MDNKRIKEEKEEKKHSYNTHLANVLGNKEQ